MSDNILDITQSSGDRTSNSITDFDGNKKYTLPKNAKKLAPNILDKLSPYERAEYERAMSRPKKVGYAIYHKKHNKFYSISIFDFLPFFLGTIYSFLRFCSGYGDLKSQVYFDKKLLWDFKSAFILGCVYTFFIVPLILLLISFVYPFIITDGGEITKGWEKFVMAINEGQGLGTAIKEYFLYALRDIFKGNNLIITLVLFSVLSMCNTKTFLYKFLLRQKREYIFSVQKEHIKDEIIKLKVSKKK